jgi:hypothetical protein
MLVSRPASHAITLVSIQATKIVAHSTGVLAIIWPCKMSFRNSHEKMELIYAHICA